MGKYVESHLNRNEEIIQKAPLTKLFLLGTWLKGIFLCWLLFIPTIKAIIATISFVNMELAITNKRLVGKVGVINTKSLDAPLNKVQNVSTSSGLGGKIFGYGNISINTAAGEITFSGVKHPETLKSAIMNQIEQYEEDRVKEQAAQMANAMASVMNK